MATTCSSCGAEVAANASRCPACGASVPDPAGVTGRVRDLQPRTRIHWFTRFEEMELTFRVALFDDMGNVERLVPVQIGGSSFDGAISENDEVRATGRFKRGTLHAKKVENLTDGSVLTATSSLPSISKIVMAVFFAAIVAFMLFVGYQLVSGS